MTRKFVLPKHLIDRGKQEKKEILQIGERMGYGRIMQLVKECWRETLARDWPGCEGGEFQIGPCVALTERCGCERGCD